MSEKITYLVPAPAAATKPTAPVPLVAIRDGHDLLGYTLTLSGKPRALMWGHNGDASVQAWHVADPPASGSVVDWMRGYIKPAPPLPPIVPMLDPEPEPAPAPPPEPEPEREREEPGSPYEPPAEPATEPPDTWPFTLLGHDKGTYFYLGHGAQQVIELKANAHNDTNLYKLAPLSWWARQWPAKTGADWKQAVSDLITRQHRIGIYDPQRIRGRGSWWDEAKRAATVHLGDRLWIDGKEIGLHEHGTRAIYECARRLEVDFDNPLTDEEAVRLLEVCKELSWEKPSNGALLAGWIVCAHICGALRWKPNIWVHGPKSSGKSTIFEKILPRALGNNVHQFLGGTTEPALRNVVRADAMPITIDDMDSSSDRGRAMNQQILGLMRVFSSETAASLAKGSQSGVATQYKVHACYAFSAIAVEAYQGSDLSRISVLGLKQRPFSEGQYHAYLRRIEDAMPEGFASRLMARCIKLIPVIRKNAELYGQAVAAKTGNQRTGDVTGHLLAGAHALASSGLVRPERATVAVNENDDIRQLVEEQKQQLAETNDGERCLWHLAEQVIADTENGRMMRASVFDLVRAAASDTVNDAPAAKHLLLRYGLKLKDGYLLVANDHSGLRELMAKSNFPQGWAGVLKSIDGSKSHDSTRFGARMSRAVAIPLAMLMTSSAPKPE